MANSFVQLSLEERRTLSHLHFNKTPVAKIARIMQRHRSTIYREIRRNWWHDTEVQWYAASGRLVPHPVLMQAGF